jgi:cellulose synthase/poly-beta-1,6-N-acetylglucosamine synthase-like glycosyltransferase
MALGVILLPLLMFCIDGVAATKARHHAYRFAEGRDEDFTVLVPIYGNIKYLENVAFLSPYGSKVVLCTTGSETEEFLAELRAVGYQHGFRIFVADWSASQNVNKRATSGTIRDRLIRDALNEAVTTTYVIPLDADSTSTNSLDEAVGELRERGGDIASVRLVPRNSDTLLAKLQSFEYRLAMNFRFAMPWLVSGACHVARANVLRDIMNRHSLFFQGNDVEIGLIAKVRGYNVVHIPFEVNTTVPSKFKPWFNQRLAWAGGEFRLFIMNFRYIFRHPFFWFYGSFVTIMAFPLRWMAASTLGWALVTTLVLYLALVVLLHRKSRSGWVLLMPLYTLFSSLIMTPLGVGWYFWMAFKDRNMGIIRPNRSLRRKPMTVA